MARLIDADALIAWIKGSQQMTSKMKAVIAKIETMPSEHRQREWIYIRNDVLIVRVECPKCHRRFSFPRGDKWKCCPVCLTMMKG